MKIGWYIAKTPLHFSLLYFDGAYIIKYAIYDRLKHKVKLMYLKWKSIIKLDEEPDYYYYPTTIDCLVELFRLNNGYGTVTYCLLLSGFVTHCGIY